MELMELQDVKTILDKPEKKIYLTYRQKDQKYYIKKVISRFGKIEVYEQLKSHPHPHMPKIFDIIQDHDELILIEEFVNGMPLDQKMQINKLERDVVTSIFLQLCDIVKHLHSFDSPIIHRDIKPGNVLCLNDDVYLIDYDIAREYEKHQTKDTTVIGSVGYAAPEQYGFKQSDTRSDIYAMGVLLNEMLTGAYPNVTLAKGPFHKVIEKSIALDPDNRYQSVSELEKAYRRIVDEPLPPIVKHNDSYMLPGLQNPSMLKRLFAFIGYILMIIVAFGTDLTSTHFYTPLEEFIFRLVLLIQCLLFVLIPCNYHNIQSFTPLHKSKRRLVKYINYIIIWYTVLVILAFAFALLRGIFASLL